MSTSDPLVAALLDAAAGGAVSIVARDLGDFASAYNADTATVTLNPAASVAQLRDELADALAALVALDDNPGVRSAPVTIPAPRPALELIAGGVR